MTQEENPIQLRLVEPQLDECTQQKRKLLKHRRRPKDELYKNVVRDATSQIDHKILARLTATEAELTKTRQELARQNRKQDEMVEQTKRYQATLDKLLPSITEKIINNEAPHVAYSQCDWAVSDVAVVNGNVPTEIVYPYTAGVLGQFVGIRPARMGVILRKFDIFADSTYHHEFRIGRSSVCHRYKLSALKEIFFRRKDRRYSSILTSAETAQVHEFLKMRAQENAL